jgi:hypothetical protein
MHAYTFSITIIARNSPLQAYTYNNVAQRKLRHDFLFGIRFDLTVDPRGKIVVC